VTKEHCTLVYTDCRVSIGLGLEEEENEEEKEKGERKRERKKGWQPARGRTGFVFMHERSPSGR